MNTTRQIKERLLELIQKSEDEVLLEIVYQILNQETAKENDRIQLTEDQEKELLDAYEESLNEKNLIDHETLIAKNSKWLGK
jgi:hypothetical protein